MKRILVLLLAMALSLTIFTACGKTTDSETTEPVDVSEYTTEAPEETDPPEETTGIEETSDPEATTAEATSAEATSAGETTATTAAAADPTTMNKTQLIQYYNDAINLVRSGKPGYTRVEVLKVDSIKTSLAGGILDGLLNPIVKNLMPGEPKTSSKKKGESNVDHFYLKQATSNVGANDITSISAKKEGANYVITLTMGKENNPEKSGASKYSRVFMITTRQELLDDLAGSGLTGQVADTTLTYRDGKSVITVNDKGQIIKARGEFFVDADAKNTKISMFNPDIIAYQSSSWDYTGFSW